MTKNPYNMKRTWTVEVDESVNVTSTTSQREKLLEQKLHNMEKKFQEFQEQQNKILQALCEKNQTSSKGKGKGRGKKSIQSEPNSQNLDFQTAVEQEARRRLRSFIESNESGQIELDQVPSTSSSIHPSAPPPPSIISNWTEDEQSLQSFGAKTTKTIFIKKVEVTLNGIPLDLVEDKETEDEVN